MEYIVYCLLNMIFFSIIFGLIIHLIFESIKRNETEDLFFLVICLIGSIIYVVALPMFLIQMSNATGYKNGEGMNLIFGLVSFAMGVSGTRKVWPIILSNTVNNNATRNLLIMRDRVVLKENRSVHYEPASPDEDMRNQYEAIRVAERLIDDSNVKNVSLKVDNDFYINAYAEYDEIHDTGLITLTKGCLQLPIDEVAAIVGHELIHIKRKNGCRIKGSKTDRKRRFLGGVFILLHIFIISIVISYFENNFGGYGKLIVLIGALFTLGLFVFLFIYFAIDTRRFWHQIDELICDNEACMFEGVSKKGMLNLLVRLDSQGEFFKNVPWFLKFYTRYYELLEHPCTKQRIKNIKKFRKWKIIDYYKHGVVMIKWLLTGKGWAGV